MTELVIQHVPVAALRPNPWNPNRQSEAVARAERESIELYGFIDPVTVRAHPDGDGWEIIDGEHRWNEARERGDETVPTIVIDADDQQARKLTVILNETRGEADVVALGVLLADLQSGMDVDELLRGMPFSRAELDHLTSLAEYDWAGQLDGGTLPDGDGDGDGPPSGVRITLDLTDNQHRTYRNAVRMGVRELGWEDEARVVVEMLKRAARAF